MIEDTIGAGWISLSVPVSNGPQGCGNVLHRALKVIVNSPQGLIDPSIGFSISGRQRLVGVGKVRRQVALRNHTIASHNISNPVEKSFIWLS